MNWQNVCTVLSIFTFFLSIYTIYQARQCNDSEYQIILGILGIFVYILAMIFGSIAAGLAK